MKQSITLLLPVLLVLASCGTTAQYSAQRYQDGIYGGSVPATQAVRLYSKDDFSLMAAQNIADGKQVTGDTKYILRSKEQDNSQDITINVISPYYYGLDLYNSFWPYRWSWYYDPWYYSSWYRDPWFYGGYYSWYYDPWYFRDPWYYHSWYYDPWCYGPGGYYDPWYHNHYYRPSPTRPGLHGDHYYGPRRGTQSPGVRNGRPQQGRGNSFARLSPGGNYGSAGAAGIVRNPGNTGRINGSASPSTRPSSVGTTRSSQFRPGFSNNPGASNYTRGYSSSGSSSSASGASSKRSSSTSSYSTPSTSKNSRSYSTGSNTQRQSATRQNNTQRQENTRSNYNTNSYNSNNTNSYNSNSNNYSSGASNYSRSYGGGSYSGGSGGETSSHSGGGGSYSRGGGGRR